MTTWYSKAQSDTLLAGKDAAGAAASAQAAAIAAAATAAASASKSADTITDGATNKAYTAAEKTKLAGVAPSATANRADSAVDALLAAKADLVGGFVPTAQLPSISLENSVVVANRTAMLALTPTQVQPGDIAVDTSTGSTRGSYILTATDPTQIGSWLLLNAPLDAVQTVNGQSGTVVLGKADVGLGSVDNTPDASKPVSSAQAAADVAAQAAAQAASLSNSEPAALVTSPDGVSQAGLWVVQRTRPQTPPSKVISRFPSGHGWTGGADDTTIKLFTDRSYKITTNGAGGNAYLSSPTIAADFSASAVRIIFQVNNAARLANVNINAKTDGSNIWQASVPCNPISGEWCIATVPRAYFKSIVGTPSWSSISALDVFVADNGGSAPVQFNLAAFELIPDLASVYPSGVFILEADDGYIGQKTYLAPTAAQRGVPVTYNVISDRFTGGTPASGMTASDLRTFQDQYGWSIACHAYAGADHDLNPGTATQMETSFLRQKQWLHANGLHSGADHLGLCPGTGSPVAAGTMMDAIRRNFRSARVNNGYVETATPADTLRLRSILFSGQTNAQLQTNIDNAASAGGAFIFTVHDVIAGSTNGTSNGLAAIAANNLGTILTYAASKGMVFRTREAWLEGR